MTALLPASSQHPARLGVFASPKTSRIASTVTPVRTSCRCARQCARSASRARSYCSVSSAANSPPSMSCAANKKACARPELRLKDRLDDHLESRLHDPVLDRRDPQWAGSPVTFGKLYPFDRVRPVAAVLQAVLKLLQISLRLSREPFDALAIHPAAPW